MLSEEWADPSLDRFEISKVIHMKRFQPITVNADAVLCSNVNRYVSVYIQSSTVAVMRQITDYHASRAKVPALPSSHQTLHHIFLASITECYLLTLQHCSRKLSTAAFLQ